MIPPDGDHAADKFTWEILVRCGDPSVAAVGATLLLRHHANGWFGMPDNVRRSTAKAGSGSRPTATPTRRPAAPTDLWAVETEGAARGTSKHFFRVPGRRRTVRPVFTPDGETLFVAVQHPGETAKQWKAFGRASTSKIRRPAGRTSSPICRRGLGRRDHQARRRQDRKLGPADARRRRECWRARNRRPRAVPATAATGSSGAQMTRLRPACLAA